ncbi:hypothetical protein P3T36_006625 [Kitasatospora sp. MAP12-15]|uniref:hypothetical protein n=1 Tax=unclassified Kitasatospora TaxID=2633591 RepID=UPI002474EBFE|nr:hypothetical protein [Kitasatospora sp. MAP12-44]MDH6115433.1 hypothetical protein [Kitasatospora sp. MAP12-44]
MGEESSAHLSLTVREVGTANLYALLQALLTGTVDLPGRPLDEAAMVATAHTLIAHTWETLAELTPQALVEHARVVMRGALPAQ